MDAVHERHLTRILENRRRRGVLGQRPFPNPAEGEKKIEEEGRASSASVTATQTSNYRPSRRLSVERGCSPLPVSKGVQTSFEALNALLHSDETVNVVPQLAHDRGSSPPVRNRGVQAVREDAETLPDHLSVSSIETASTGHRRVHRWDASLPPPKGEREKGWLGGTVRPPNDSGRGRNGYVARRYDGSGRPITEFGTLYAAPTPVPSLQYTSTPRGGYRPPPLEGRREDDWRSPRRPDSSPPPPPLTRWERTSPSRATAGYSPRAPSTSWREMGGGYSSPSRWDRPQERYSNPYPKENNNDNLFRPSIHRESASPSYRSAYSPDYRVRNSSPSLYRSGPLAGPERRDFHYGDTRANNDRNSVPPPTRPYPTTTTSPHGDGSRIIGNVGIGSSDYKDREAAADEEEEGYRHRHVSPDTLRWTDDGLREEEEDPPQQRYSYNGKGSSSPSYDKKVTFHHRYDPNDGGAFPEGGSQRAPSRALSRKRKGPATRSGMDGEGDHFSSSSSSSSDEDDDRLVPSRGGRAKSGSRKPQRSKRRHSPQPQKIKSDYDLLAQSLLLKKEPEPKEHRKKKKSVKRVGGEEIPPSLVSSGDDGTTHLSRTTTTRYGDGKIAANVIYQGNAVEELEAIEHRRYAEEYLKLNPKENNTNGKDSKSTLIPRLPPPPQSASANTHPAALGLPDVRSTMDLRTSVQVVSRGDWFYKWTANGREVHPRFVWVDTKSYLLVWSKRETHDPTFSGSARLETICQVTPREVTQLDDDGLPIIYHVLLIETTKRVLQLATERKEKADVWFEALNNIMTFVRRDDITKGTLRAD